MYQGKEIDGLTYALADLQLEAPVTHSDEDLQDEAPFAWPTAASG